MPVPLNARQGPESGKIDELARIFASKLLEWNSTENTRQMPWKGEKDPYRIWLSEVILQQTKVEQGLKYYENFTNVFPDVKALATAPEASVFKQWEGLGYYSRCRNLIHTAKHIAGELNGRFPDTYESILSLKGVGSYTAAAISSFAYNLPHAVLDGNVYRVLSRIFDIDVPIDSAAGKKQFSALAQSVLPEGRAGEYNQAIMDFGAVVCKPSPNCSSCFFNAHCKAFRAGHQDLLPIKEKKIKKKERWFNYLVLTCKDRILVRQRKARDIWQDLFEFLLLETGKVLERQELLDVFDRQYGKFNYRAGQTYAVSQQLTHQSINFQFMQLELESEKEIAGFWWIKKEEMADYAFPRTLQQFIATGLK
ncbi:MAG TPA: A/G-specific adenine glycosylase [Flavisolibacter sp.]|nr:A/G-specific adenine glycosylase [Flavisolibacter sp.]